MKEVQSRINRGKRNPKRILYVAIGISLLIIVGAAFLRANLMGRQSTELTEWMLNNPAPLPAFLYKVSPAPSSKYQGSNEAICVTFNTRTPPLGPSLTPEEEASRVNNSHLYLDGSDTATDPGGGIVYGTPDEFTMCWYGQFSGLHLAQITMDRGISETLSYQWAFIAR
jgi:hypothetical protein